MYLLVINILWFFRFPQQEGECEVDLEMEGEVEGECDAEEVFEEMQDRDKAEHYPAVIVEEVPGANLLEEQGYSAQVMVCDDEAYLMQEVGDEQEVEAGEKAPLYSIYQTCNVMVTTQSFFLCCWLMHQMSRANFGH